MVLQIYKKSQLFTDYTYFYRQHHLCPFQDCTDEGFSLLTMLTVTLSNWMILIRVYTLLWAETGTRSIPKGYWLQNRIKDGEYPTWIPPVGWAIHKIFLAKPAGHSDIWFGLIDKLLKYAYLV